MVKNRRLTYVLAVLVMALALVAGFVVAQKKAQPVTAASFGTYNFHTAAITVDGAGTNEPWVFGADEIDVFSTLDLGSGITQTIVKVQTSYDGTNWTDALNSSGAAVSVTHTTDGTKYVTVDPVPGIYMRVYFDVTGTGTVTPTVKGVGRTN